MPTKSAFSAVGLAHKVCLAAEEQGYTPEFLNSLAENPTLFRDMLQVQLGFAEIKHLDHIIDCDADPFMPEGWSVHLEDQLPNRVLGAFRWNPAEVSFYLSKAQRKSKVIEGNKLREELADKPVLNANVLDYLLAHPHLIPEEWKKDEHDRTRYIFFWGTIYRDPNGGLYVRCLYWNDGRWGWHYLWLDDGFDGRGPAALRKF